MPKLSSGKSFCAKLSSAKISSPVGNWRVDACPKGLHLVKLAPEVNNDNFLELGSENVDLVDDHLPNEKVECFDEIHIWMRIYFSTDSTLQKQKQLPKVPLCPSLFASGSFRSRVWQTLATEVPFGRTVSYRDLAELTGSPKAFQAVGSAMSNNPISLVVPCHRVVKADGKTGNYSKATKNDVKIWLLDHESSRKNC